MTYLVTPLSGPGFSNGALFKSPFERSLCLFCPTLPQTPKTVQQDSGPPQMDINCNCKTGVPLFWTTPTHLYTCEYIYILYGSRSTYHEHVYNTHQYTMQPNLFLHGGRKS